MSRERNELGMFVKGHINIGGFKKGSKHYQESKEKINKN